MKASDAFAIGKVEYLNSAIVTPDSMPWKVRHLVFAKVPCSPSSFRPACSFFAYLLFGIYTHWNGGGSSARFGMRFNES